MTTDVTTPKVPGIGLSEVYFMIMQRDILPPPPRSAQNKSGFEVALAVTKLPLGRTTSIERTYSFYMRLGAAKYSQRIDLLDLPPFPPDLTLENVHRQQYIHLQDRQSRENIVSFGREHLRATQPGVH